MSYSDKTVLTDADGKPIPQIWDPAVDNFVPYEGKVRVIETPIVAFSPRTVEAATPTRLDTDLLPNRRYVDICMAEDVTGYIGNSDLTGAANGIPVTQIEGYRLYVGSNMPIYGVGGTFLVVEVA